MHNKQRQSKHLKTTLASESVYGRQTYTQACAHTDEHVHTHKAPSEETVDKGFSSLALLSLFNKEDSHAASALAKQWRKERFHRRATKPTNLLTQADIFKLLLFLLQKVSL